MLGLVFLMGAAFFILEKGHLFAGWRRRRRKDEEPLPEEKVPVREVGRLKNAPIVVNKYAWFCLINAIGLIALGIILTVWAGVTKRRLTLGCQNWGLAFFLW